MKPLTFSRLLWYARFLKATGHTPTERMAFLAGLKIGAAYYSIEKGGDQ